MIAQPARKVKGYFAVSRRAHFPVFWKNKELLAAQITYCVWVNSPI